MKETKTGLKELKCAGGGATRQVVISALTALVKS